MKINKIIIQHVSGSKTNQKDEFDFSKNDSISIGRSTDSMIKFDPDVDAGVSRAHAVLRKGNEQGQFFIEDNKSLNGVLVNNEKINGIVEVFPGDHIQLGLKGPEFIFDLDPRPTINKATQLMEPVAATQEMTIEESVPAAPIKQGIGKETLERAIVVERKKSYKNVAAIMAGIVLLCGAMAFTFKDKLFPAKEIVTEKTTVIRDVMDAESIASENMNKVVLIETGWKLVHAKYGDDIYHEYTMYEDPKTKQKYQLPIYMEVEPNVIEPLLGLRKNVQLGEPISARGAGTGFVVDEDGLIMTNKHVTSSWRSVPYNFPVQQGVLLRVVNGKWANAGIIESPRNWIPGNTTLFGREPISGKTVTAENTYMDVTFAKTSQRNRATIAKESEEHDLAMIKINLGGDLTPVKFASGEKEVREGQKVLSMGFPGLSPDQIIVTKDQSDQRNSVKMVPSPTIADGIIGKVIRSSSDASLSEMKNNILSFQGDAYQMSINTGSGNSGGPVFNKDGEVISILCSVRADWSATKFTYSVPAKYALKLMGTQTVIK